MLAFVPVIFSKVLTNDVQQMVGSSSRYISDNNNLQFQVYRIFMSQSCDARNVVKCSTNAIRCTSTKGTTVDVNHRLTVQVRTVCTRRRGSTKLSNMRYSSTICGDLNISQLYTSEHRHTKVQFILNVPITFLNIIHVLQHALKNLNAVSGYVINDVFISTQLK